MTIMFECKHCGLQVYAKEANGNPEVKVCQIVCTDCIPASLTTRRVERTPELLECEGYGKHANQGYR